MSLQLTLVETDRLAGDVELWWNAVSGATSYTVQDNNADLIPGAASPAVVSGLEVGTSHVFKIVAYTASGAVQSNEVAFEYASQEIETWNQPEYENAGTIPEGTPA